jgi:RNA polymerase primary sigma factor
VVHERPVLTSKDENKLSSWKATCQFLPTWISAFIIPPPWTIWTIWTVFEVLLRLTFEITFKRVEMIRAFVGASENSSFYTSQPKDRARAERILKNKIEFINSDEFSSMGVTSYSKCEAVPFADTVNDNNNDVPVNRVFRKSNRLDCLAPALNEPALSFAEEQHEFRRMNYLKYAAAQIQASLDPFRPDSAQMDQIERYLAEAKQIRDRLIESNLRLVMSNAGQYCTTQYSYEDLVSDGTLALMEAVEKFTYQTGFRFSTYAVHAIRRSFFRKIERKQKDRKRFTVTDPEVMSTAPDSFEADPDAASQQQLMQHIVSALAEHLTARELHIIEARFGLNGRTEPQTLVQLSTELGICKERVRQVEGLALKKLHALATNFRRVPMDAQISA